ncbi:MAG: hypothetical protein GC202_09395 [Alphaproteobacteria bacterium]|nr:hypothetical protein [Alphaproteobacteria bacterium]
MTIRPLHTGKGQATQGRRFLARRLTGADVLRAFPLAQLAAGHLTLPAWLRYAEAMGAEPPGMRGRRRRQPREESGLLGIEDGRGYLQALCSFAVRPDLAAGRRLDIDNLVAFGLIDSEGPAGAMLGSIEQLARELDCPAFAIRLPPGIAAATDSRGALDALLGAKHDQPGIYRFVATAK